MQAQMNLHRQMPTRKVELSYNLIEASGRYKRVNYAFSSQEPAPTGFEHAWNISQQIHQRQLAFHRLQQQQHVSKYDSEGLCSPAIPEAPGVASQVPSASLPSLIASPLKEPIDVKCGAVGDDLNHWNPFNVGLDDDQLFDFIKT